MQELRRRDWLLLLFDRTPRPLDRVRIQKAMFLFAQRSKAPGGEKYEFVPYSYGPFSFQIYPDLDRLLAEGLLKAELSPGLSSPLYSLAPLGEEGLKDLRTAAPPHRMALLHKLREYVMAYDFSTLLTNIYRLYPEYATRSVFNS